jgi:hypothetical protein
MTVAETISESGMVISATERKKLLYFNDFLCIGLLTI